MNFEPQNFFIGLMDFFSILLPGALLTFLLIGEAGPVVLGERYAKLVGVEAYRDKKAFEEHQKNPPYQRWVSQIEPEMVDDFQLLFNVDAVWSFGGSIPIPP